MTKRSGQHEELLQAPSASVGTLRPSAIMARHVQKASNTAPAIKNSYELVRSNGITLRGECTLNPHNAKSTIPPRSSLLRHIV